MAENFCIRLPFLHAGFSKNAENSAMFPRLCPGIDAGAGYWTPPRYVFDGKQAKKLLHEMRQASLDDTESMRLALNPGLLAAQAGFRSEMDDLARFAAGSGADCAHLKARLLLEQAQKILLWIWMQEEAYSEITRLSRACASTEAHLRGQFTETPEHLGGHAEKMFEPDSSLMPSWRTCAANAALFVPEDIPFVAEGPMREELLEIFSFRPAIEAPLAFASSLPENMLFIREPLWKILGHSRPDTVFAQPGWGALADCYNRDRIWLVWRDE